MSYMKAIIGDVDFEDFLKIEKKSRRGVARVSATESIGWKELMVEIECDIKEAEKMQKEYIESLKHNLLTHIRG